MDVSKQSRPEATFQQRFAKGLSDPAAPDDLEKFQKNWVAAMKGDSEKLDLEYRFIADGGDYRWQRNVGTVTRDKKAKHFPSLVLLTTFTT